MMFENLVKENKVEFLSKVRQISANLGIEPDWLMIVMSAESGINPQAVNYQPKKGDSKDPYIRSAYRATGLIQFMPHTAENIGTTNQTLYRMNNVQQLVYVEKYFKYLGMTGKMHCVEDLYLATFFPIAVGKPDTFILQARDLSAYAVASENTGIDLNKDLKITVAEFKQYIKNYLKKKTLV